MGSRERPEGRIFILIRQQMSTNAMLTSIRRSGQTRLTPIVNQRPTLVDGKNFKNALREHRLGHGRPPYARLIIGRRNSARSYAWFDVHLDVLPKSCDHVIFQPQAGRPNVAQGNALAFNACSNVSTTRATVLI